MHTILFVCGGGERGGVGKLYKMKNKRNVQDE